MARWQGGIQSVPRVASLPALAAMPTTPGSGLNFRFADSRQSPSPAPSPSRKSRQATAEFFRSAILSLEVEFAAALDSIGFHDSSLLKASPQRVAMCFHVLRKHAGMVDVMFRPLLARLHDELLHAVYDRSALGHPPHFTRVAQLEAQLESHAQALQAAARELERLRVEHAAFRAELALQDGRRVAATDAQDDHLSGPPLRPPRAPRTGGQRQSHPGSARSDAGDARAGAHEEGLESVPIHRHERLQEAFEQERAQLGALRRAYREMQAHAREAEDTDASLALRARRSHEEAEQLRVRVSELEEKWTPRPKWASCRTAAERAGQVWHGGPDPLPGLHAGQSSKANLGAVNLVLLGLWARLNELEGARPNDLPVVMGSGASLGRPACIVHEGRLRNLRLRPSEVREAAAAAWVAKLESVQPMTLAEALAAVGRQRSDEAGGEMGAEDWLYSVLDGCKRLAPMDPAMRLFSRILYGQAPEEEWRSQQRMLRRVIDELRARDRHENGQVMGKCSLDGALHAVREAYPALSPTSLVHLLCLLRDELLPRKCAWASPTEAEALARAVVLPEAFDQDSAERLVPGGAAAHAAWQLFTRFERQRISVPYAELLVDDGLVRSSTSSFVKALCEEHADEPDLFVFRVASLLLHRAASTTADLTSIETCRVAIQAVDPLRDSASTDSLLVSLFSMPAGTTPEANTRQKVSTARDAEILVSMARRRVTVAELLRRLALLCPRWHGRPPSNAEAAEAFLRLRPPKQLGPRTGANSIGCTCPDGAGRRL